MNEDHPFVFALKCIAPFLGANVCIYYEGMEGQGEPYPRLEISYMGEGASSYDMASQAWRVNLILQITFVSKDSNVCLDCISRKEREEERIRFQLDSMQKLRKLLQILVDPTSLNSPLVGSSLNCSSFKFSPDVWRLEEVIEGAYLMKYGPNNHTGAGLQVVLSYQENKLVCCDSSNLGLVRPMLLDSSQAAQIIDLNQKS